MRAALKLLFGLLVIALFPGVALPAFSGMQEPVQVSKEVTATREAMALTYLEGKTISVKFKGTHRLPKASGEAKVERKKGVTEIEIELDEMKPATFFGGDYSTYVLWVVSPEGHADNVGEFVLEGNRSKLNVSTPLDTFGVFITAEPHFLVSSPSRFIVLENTRPVDDVRYPIQVSHIKYRGFEGVYDSQRDTLANLPEARGEVRGDLVEARTAVKLAERAGAEKFAAQELAKAREALEKTRVATEAGSDARNLMAQAHETVRLAVEAQKLAEQRTVQAAVDAEQQARVQAQQQAQQMAAAKTEAESAAERARKEAEMKEHLRREAEERARQAATAKTEAELGAQRAREEATEARAKMLQALSAVAETRETARGLILNLPDILFDFNKATLRPQAREVLSKISGILLVARGYHLSVEGHADSIGSEEYNQRLSERRAQGVRDFLVQAGLSSDILSARGFGESQPIAENTTDDGRQKNRRVEIVIEERLAKQ